MKALIDADRIPYALGNLKNEEGTDYLKWPFVKARVDSMIEKTITECKADSHTLYLTDSASNFRLRVAKILPYKGTRPTEKPHYYDKIREYLIKHREAELCVGVEADDQLGIDQCKDDTVISSVDKDLDLIPGLHHNPVTKELYSITKEEGIRNFYKQLLTGDKVDNILGLYGIGAKSAHLTNLDKLTDELEMYKYVKGLYTKYFGSFWYVYMVENAILLWILREPMDKSGPEGHIGSHKYEQEGEKPTPYIVQRFKQLEGRIDYRYQPPKEANSVKLITTPTNEETPKK